METIAFTKSRLPFGWMGNMSPYPVMHNGKIWRTTEAVFQSMRFSEPSIIESIRREVNPMQAKRIAKEFSKEMTVEQLSEEDLLNMRFCIRLKIEYHPELIMQLISTGDAFIVEDCTSRGGGESNLFWGAVLSESGEWEGKNALGREWERLRAHLVKIKGLKR